MRSRHFALLLDACVGSSGLDLEDERVYDVVIRDRVEKGKHAIIACGPNQERSQGNLLYAILLAG